MLLTNMELKETRNGKVTQADFDRLPMIVSRFTFKFFSGLNNEDLRAAVESGEVRVYRRAGGKYAKYYKTDLAKLTGFKI